MGHVPHVFVPTPWSDSDLVVSPETKHHLDRVLRRTESEVTYTDGVGRVGSGRYKTGVIERGEERAQARPSPRVVMAVAVPDNASRTRMVVEKLAELGADDLLWLETRWSQGRLPRSDRVEAWSVAALQQSRGAWLMTAGGAIDVSALDDRSETVLVADPAGESFAAVAAAIGDEVVVAVGPEGGFAPDEIPDQARRVSLGERVLRVETAAVVIGGLITTWRHQRGRPSRD